MIESVNNLVVRLENGFANLDEKEKEYDNLKSQLEQYEKILKFVNGNAKKLNKYEDQSLILDAIERMNSTLKEYDAACYLVDSEDESVMILPQYRNSKIFLETVINCLKMKKDQINSDVLDLEGDCSKMNLNKKYYQILSEDSPFIEDVDEFLKLLENENVFLEDKNLIISYVIENNVSNYIKRIKGEEK